MTALAVVAVPIIGGAQSATAAGSVVVSSVDFEDGTKGTWTQSGNPTYAYVSDGTQVLSVTNRANSWDSISSPTGLFEAGVEYTLSMRVKLASGAAATQAHFTAADGSYTWIAATPVNDAGWTTVTGKYTLPAGATAATTKVSVEVDAVGGVLPSFSVDDILITKPAAAPVTPTVTTVSSVDFEDGTKGTWTQSGSPTLAVVADGGGQVLSVTGRANSWDTIQSPAGLFEAGTQYTLSMRVKLAAGTTGSTQAHFTVADGSYTWVGATTVDASGWTTVTGTYTLLGTATAATTKVSIEADAIGGVLPSFLVDDVLITKPVVVTPPTVVTVSSVDFEDGTQGTWTQSGSPTLAVVTDGSGKALSVTGRANSWDTIQSPAGLFEAGKEYTLSMRVKLAEGTTGSTQAHFTVADGSYTWVGATTVDASGWTTVTGTYTLLGTATAATTRVSIEAGAIGGVLPSFLVDDILVTTPGAGGTDPVDPVDPTFVPGGAVDPTTTPVATAAGEGDRAALTFDDGPNPGETETLLDYLQSKGLHATFCVIGQNITAPGGAAVLQRIVAEGHTLCNHSTDYNDMGSLTSAQATQKMKDNLAIIRTALGNPNQQVPFFRAPNGSWGSHLAADAVALGMQPLAVTNLINDWDDATQANVETLKANLRTSMKSGQVVLMHDGGGDRVNTVAAAMAVVDERLADGWTFTLPSVTVAPQQSVGDTVIGSDFESDLGGWYARDTGAATKATAALTATAAHGGVQSALVSGRVSQGQGLAHDAAGVLLAGNRYDVSAWIKFAADSTPGDVVLSVKAGNQYLNLLSFTNMSNSAWVHVTGKFVAPAGAEQLYFETKWANGEAGNISPLLFDDITVTVTEPQGIETNLVPIKDTTDFAVGAAVGSAVSPYTDLTVKHFDQVTPENTMKPESWYTGDSAHSFVTTNAGADALMTFARDSGTKVYGHVLVWHGQTPDWFFQDEDGAWLTSSEDDKQVLRDRMKTHIDNVAKYLSDKFGKFGSATNPLYAFDVVNETVSDTGSGTPDGLRNSHWHDILGEEFIDLSFQYANEAFNDTYAAAGQAHPVTLFINDYNTELPGKQKRYHDLIERLLARDVPLDGVGHQFHVSMSLPVATLGDTLDAFADLDLKQAVTELDVTTGTPVTEAKLVDQGYYYKSAFEDFRAFHARTGELFSATVWGLTDNLSWRNTSGAPLLFDEELKAKPAYFGVVDGDLAAPLRTANVFRGDVQVEAGATDALTWSQLPLHVIEGATGFQLRWETDHLTAYVTVDDATHDASDAVQLTLEGQTYTVRRDGTGDVDAVVSDTSDGYALVAHLPMDGAAQGDTPSFDVTVTDGTTTTGWNKLDAMGTLSLLEPLSYLEVVQAAAVPAIDGDQDAGWADAHSVTTSKVTSGALAGATADVKTLWKGDTLYVYATVTDPVVNVQAADGSPWLADSLEIFVDPGNAKNSSYRYDDSQIRITANNKVSVGTGDEGYQKANVTSATRLTATGYVVEAAIGLHDNGGLGTFHGLDFQVNDATADAVRSSVHGWAEPNGTGYQTTERWGVGRLVAAPTPAAPKVTQQPQSVSGAFGSQATLTVAASGQPTPTVRWQIRTDGPLGTHSWRDVRGGTKPSFTVKVDAEHDGATFRAVFTNSVGSVTTKEATVRVTKAKPAVTTQPASVSGALGSTVKLTVAASGYPVPTVRWEQRAAGTSTWRAAAGTSTTLSVKVSATTAGAQYRAVFTNSLGSATTKAATVTVTPTAPKITSQPKSVTAKAGSTVTFTVGVSGYPAPTVQWYRKAKGASGWTKVTGAPSTGLTLSFVAKTSSDGAQYRAVVTSTAGTATSAAATLVVTGS